MAHKEIFIHGIYIHKFMLTFKKTSFKIVLKTNDVQLLCVYLFKQDSHFSGSSRIHILVEFSAKSCAPIHEYANVIDSNE